MLYLCVDRPLLAWSPVYRTRGYGLWVYQGLSQSNKSILNCLESSRQQLVSYAGEHVNLRVPCGTAQYVFEFSLL
jgi:hypothetical protein